MAEPASKFQPQAQPEPSDVKEDVPYAVIGFRRRFDITEQPDTEQTARGVAPAKSRPTGSRWGSPSSKKPISYAPGGQAQRPTDGIAKPQPPAQTAAPQAEAEPEIGRPLTQQQIETPNSRDDQQPANEEQEQEDEEQEEEEAEAEAEDEEEGEAEAEEAQAAQAQAQAQQQAAQNQPSTALISDRQQALAGQAFVNLWWEQMWTGIAVLWSVPVLDFYILFGLFSKKPFWHQLSKLKIAVIVMLNILIFLLFMLLIMIILKWACSGFSGFGIRSVGFITRMLGNSGSAFNVCHQMDNVLGGIQIPQ